MFLDLAARETALHPGAARSASAVYRHPEPGRFLGPRLQYWRDGDRVIHSFAFSRYNDKTQVFSHEQDDRVSHRVIHVQFLARIARLICRMLGLNVDLAEAIALGHDVGHCPFGHQGEAALDALCHEHGAGHFHHNAQGITWLDKLESPYLGVDGKGFRGLNLSAQVLDGILTHDGERHPRLVSPTGDVPGADNELFALLDSRLAVVESTHGGVELAPFTLEACVVRHGDVISYLGRDIEDAIATGLVRREDVPDTVLGTHNRSIIDVLVKDLVETSKECELGAFGYSTGVHQALEHVYRFNMARIYRHPRVKERTMHVPARMRLVFEAAMRDVEQGNMSSPVYTDHIDLARIEFPLTGGATPATVARDYVAGMTDRYFSRQFAVLESKGLP